MLAAGSRDEILSVLRIALSCLQEDPNTRPSMSQVVSMLVGNSDIAVDLVKELKDQQLRFDDLFDGTAIKIMNSQHCREKALRIMLNSTSSTSPLIELSGMEPR